MVLTRDSLLEMMKLNSERVEIGDGEVIMYELGAAEYADLWTDPKNEKIVGKQLVDGKEVDKTEINMARFTACLIVNSCKNEEGVNLFTEADIDIIKNSKKEIFMKLSEVARRLNGMGGEVKNSEVIPTEKDCGESQLPLDLDTPTT